MFIMKNYLNGEKVEKSSKQTIVKVEPIEVGYDIVTNSQTGFIIRKDFIDIIPCVGDNIVFYTICLTRVVGIELNGKLFSFLSEEDE